MNINKNNDDLLKYINKKIKNSEKILLNINSSYEDIIHNKYKNLINEDNINTANYEAGRINILKDIKKIILNNIRYKKIKK